jgi:hypothetical protein
VNHCERGDWKDDRRWPRAFRLFQETRMTRAARFVIEENVCEDVCASPPVQVPAAGSLRQVSCALPWVELALLLPSKLLAAVGWLAIPLFVFAVVPVVLLGTLLLAQAPVFFVLWKLFGTPRSESAGFADENSPG